MELAALITCDFANVGKDELAYEITRLSEAEGPAPRGLCSPRRMFSVAYVPAGGKSFAARMAAGPGPVAGCAPCAGTAPHEGSPNGARITIGDV